MVYLRQIGSFGSKKYWNSLKTIDLLKLLCQSQYHLLWDLFKLFSIGRELARPIGFSCKLVATASKLVFILPSPPLNYINHHILLHPGYNQHNWFQHCFDRISHDIFPSGKWRKYAERAWRWPFWTHTGLGSYDQQWALNICTHSKLDIYQYIAFHIS